MTSYEHGNLSPRLKGGVINVFVCRAMVRARMATCRPAIESRASGLTPEPKIMSKLLGTTKLWSLEVGTSRHIKDFLATYKNTRKSKTCHDVPEFSQRFMTCKRFLTTLFWSQKIFCDIMMIVHFEIMADQSHCWTSESWLDNSVFLSLNKDIFILIFGWLEKNSAIFCVKSSSSKLSWKSLEIWVLTVTKLYLYVWNPQKFSPAAR